MDLVHRLNREEGKTIVLVLHDLNLAARYADHLIALRSGAIAAEGPPDRLMNPAMLREVFEVEARVVRDGSGAVLYCVPEGRAALRSPKSSSSSGEPGNAKDRRSARYCGLRTRN